MMTAIEPRIVTLHVITWENTQAKERFTSEAFKTEKLM